MRAVDQLFVHPEIVGGVGIDAPLEDPCYPRKAANTYLGHFHNRPKIIARGIQGVITV